MRTFLFAKRIYFAPHTEKSIISLENRNTPGVYALICRVTNKIYVGSSINLGPRLLDYMQPAYLGIRASSPVIRAIVKYGFINFCFVILETCLLESVLEREQYWLDFLKPEYNLSPTAGSTLGIYLSEETKTKLSLAHLGKTHTLETRRLMSETRRGPNHPMFGKSPSEETRANNHNFGLIRSAETVDLMRKNHPNTKTIYQYASDQITFIAKFDSIRQAALLTGLSRNYISRCLALGTLAHGKWFFSLSAPA